MPSIEIVNRVIAALKRSADIEYFFGKLNSPSWIEPLREKGFFRNPPVPELEGGYVRFPFWPASQYLARMAEQAPELVFSIFQEILGTENPRVQEDIVTAALAMPAYLAARLARAAVSWLDSPYLLVLPSKLAKLVVHLAQGGQVRHALNVARALLAPLPADPADENDTVSLSAMHRLRPRYEMWEYERVAHEIVPALVAADPIAAISMLSDLLQSAVDITLNDASPPHDGSGLWRSTIEQSNQNSPVAEIQDVLIDSLRDAVQIYVDSNSVALADVIVDLEARRWRIFHRIALHLLRTRLDEGWDLVRHRVLDRDRVHDIDQYHEYWLLVRAAFARLDPVDQEWVIDSIAAGPTTVPEDRSEQYVKAWSRRRLAILKDVLGPQWNQVYDDLVAEVGPGPGHPEFLHYSAGMWGGPTSPQSAPELIAMRDEDLIGFLHGWKATGDFMGPSYEGVSRALSQAVARQPQRFANIASQLRQVPVMYIGGVIQGWSEALRSSVSFSWAPVLDLCAWIVEHYPAAPMSQHDTVKDLTGQWTRIEIARLLNAGFENEDNPISLLLRDQVWAVLEPLTHDPDPTLEQEAQYLGSNMDPPTLAINTTRGEAMHAVVRYAMWVYRTTATNGDDTPFPARRELPREVREVLDTHLDVTVDPSAAVRSAYGQWLPSLTFLDSPWIQERLSDILPDDPQYSYLRDAAWDTYVIFCQPYNEFFNIARNEYRKAVEQLSDLSPLGASPQENSSTRLGYHLAMLYLRDQIGLDDELVVRFFDRAAVEVRHATVTYVGHVLRESDEIPAQVIERAQRLWAMRLAEPQTHSRPGNKELTSFGWWFASGKLPGAWSIAQLINTLRLTDGQVDVGHAVFEQLAQCASTYPAEAVEAIRLIAESDQEGWRITASFDQVEAILTASLSSTDASAKDAATALVHHLGARGFYKLRSLLSA
jgi:hypothetical protein